MFSKTNVASLTISILGAVKLVLNAFGVDIFNGTEINDIANGVAAVAAVAGPIVMHIIHRKSVAAVQPAQPQAPQSPAGK